MRPPQRLLSPRPTLPLGLRSPRSERSWEPGAMTTDIDAELAAALAAVPEQLARDGVAVVPGVLSPDEAATALEHLWAAAPESVAHGIPAHIEVLDPNDANVRVFDLIAIDPLFAELIAHPVADRILTDLLGPDYIVS